MPPAERHRHGCVRCRCVYEDACDAPSENGVCYRCRVGRPSLYDQLGTFTPRECCYSHCRPVHKSKALKIDEAAVYRLSTGCPWYLCQECKRTFPFVKPRKETP